MNLTCMSRSYKDKSIGISYSVIFAFVYENERCFCDVQRPRACSALPTRLSSAHCKRVSPPDLQAEFLNTTAYLENALVLEYLFILVLLISKEKRSARCLACATEDDPILTSGLLTFTIPDVKIGLSSVAHAKQRAERFSSDIKRTRINKYSSTSAFSR